MSKALTAPANKTEETIQGLLEGPLAQAGFRLLDTQFRQEGRWVLRLTIEHSEHPVTIDECGEVSEMAGRLLDVADPITHEFSLEVTSAGLFRPLTKVAHFGQSVGKRIKLTLGPGFEPDRRQRQWQATILSVSETGVSLQLPEETLEVPFDFIKGAKLDPEL